MNKTFAFAVSVIVASAMSQHAVGQDMSGYSYPQNQIMECFDNCSFSVIYSNDSKVFNNRGALVSNTSGKVSALSINPAGWSYAAVIKGKNKDFLSVYKLYSKDELVSKIKSEAGFSCIAYSPDSKILAANMRDTHVALFNTSDMKNRTDLKIGYVAESIAISPDNYYLASSRGVFLDVWNLEDKTLRKSITADAKVNAFDFSPDGSFMVVLTEGGKLTAYDTKDFLPTLSLESLGIAGDCEIHPEGKYIAVVTGDTRISIINKLDPSDCIFIDNEAGSISDLSFMYGFDGTCYILYRSVDSFYINVVQGLKPNYIKLLSEELDEKMNAWLKMGADETLEEYKERVNDDTRLKQIRLYEQEIATRLAGDVLEASSITLGAYNAEISKLTVNFDNMPSVYLDVPESEINSFLVADNLEFRNPQYGLTSDDKFELVYLEVYNKTNNQTYTFDNRERRALDYLKLDDNYVSLDLISLNNENETKLLETVDNVMSAAIENKVLSNHTNISVDSRVVPGNNAKGEKILNYEVNVAYTVEEGFSAQEDFASGAFITGESGAASAMVEIIKQSLNGNLSEFVNPGKKVKMVVTGMADNIPITGKIAYDGRYGNYDSTPVYGETLYSISVSSATGITQNDQLAFVRAAGVRKSILDAVPALTGMDIDTEYHVLVSKSTGGQYRRIKVQFIFFDAF